MQEVIESLNGLGYEGDCLQPAVIENAIDQGLNSTVFRSLVAWITAELSVLLNLDEQLQPNSEVNEFCLELSSLLKELSCPYPALITGPIANRYQTVESRLLLLNYLSTELMAAKMRHKTNPHKQVVIEILESSAAIALKSITQNLNLGKPPQNITPKAFFEKLFTRFNEVSKQNELGKPLFAPSKQLTCEQWNKLEKLQKEIDTEYDLRRQVLITRLDVTIQSFQWSETIRNKDDRIVQRYTAKRKELDNLQCGGKSTDLIELLAARDDLLFVEKTSSANVRQNTKTELQRCIIGRVPDRGGRTNEHDIPPPEMPVWQKNRSSGGRGGGGFYNNQKPQQQRNFQPNYQQQQSRGYSDSNNFQQAAGGNHQQSNYQRQPNQSYNNRGGSSRVQGGWAGGNRDFNNQQRNEAGNNFYSGSSSYQNQQKTQSYGQNQDGFNRGGFNNRGQYNRGGRR